MLGFYFYKYKWYALLYLIIFSVAWLDNKIFEALFVLISFWSTRNIFPKTYHYENEKHPERVTMGCMIISIIVFVFVIPTTPNLNISFLASILSGSTISFVAYQVQDFIDTKNDKLFLNIEYEKLVIKYNNLNSEYTKVDKFKNECRKLKLKEDKIEFAIDALIYNMSYKDLSEKYYNGTATDKTIYTTKKRLKNKLIKILVDLEFEN